MKPKVITICNCKGGVAKTTTAVNISAGLARSGKRVLAIDLDVQANLTHALIGEIPEDALTITEAILNDKVSMKSVIRQTEVPKLDLAPAGWSMVDLELKLHSAFGRESLLKRALSDATAQEYDYIVIDNGPHVGLKVVNSLVASQYFLTPVSAEYLPLVGIRHLISVIDQIKPLNPQLRLLGYLLTMVDKREGISADIEKILRETFGEDVFKSTIRINTKLKSAPQKHKCIFDLEPKSGKGHLDYLNVTNELLQRVEKA